MTKSLPLKFSVGFIAGLCAAFFPRLIAELATTNEYDVVVLFSRNFIFLSLVFALLIGAVITILEWEDSRSPKDIFMSALAIPGIMSGALSTTTSVNDFEQIAKENAKYEKVLEQDYEIPIIAPDTGPTMLTPLSNAVPFTKENHQLSLLFISNAQADNGDFYRVGGYGLGIRKSQQSYVVVLGQATSSSEAKRKAASLRSRVPVKILQDSRQRFFITTTSGSQTKTNALLEAVRLKKEQGLSPSLMETTR